MGGLRRTHPISIRGKIAVVGVVVAALALAGCTKSASSQRPTPQPRTVFSAPSTFAPPTPQPSSSPSTGGVPAPRSSSASPISGSTASLAVSSRPAGAMSAGPPPSPTTASGVPRNGTTQYCPFTFGDSPAGPDPDYVTFLGPTQIPVGTTTPVTIGLSEEESAANVVSIAVIATASDNSNPITATETGTHDTTVSVVLPGVSGRTYTLHWVATFDEFAHPCSSELPSYSPYTVTAGA